MPRIEVRPFVPSKDLAAAAELLAVRHRAARLRLPFLRESVEIADGAAPLIQSQVDSGAKGFVAEHDGKVIGFLLGSEMLFTPTDFIAQWFAPHSISIDVTGHAVAIDGDAKDVYRWLYAAAAEDWVRRGYFDHQVGIVAGDADVQEAWLNLGFGRKFTAAVRPTAAPIAGLREGPLDVREATSEDIDVVLQLTETLDHHHLLSPMFWPVIRTAHEAVRASNLAELTSRKTPYFLAYEGAEPIGMQTFLLPGHTPAIVEPEGTVYLFDGVIEPSARSSGVGTRLLAHTMRWANGAGYEHCCLHYASANFSGAPFWQGHGFVAAEHSMTRHIDERVAWAR